MRTKVLCLHLVDILSVKPTSNSPSPHSKKPTNPTKPAITPPTTGTAFPNRPSAPLLLVAVAIVPVDVAVAAEPFVVEAVVAFGYPVVTTPADPVQNALDSLDRNCISAAVVPCGQYVDQQL